MQYFDIVEIEVKNYIQVWPVNCINVSLYKVIFLKNLII